MIQTQQHEQGGINGAVLLCAVCFGLLAAIAIIEPRVVLAALRDLIGGAR